jgi:hypothetical protein
MDTLLLEKFSDPAPALNDQDRTAIFECCNRQTTWKVIGAWIASIRMNFRNRQRQLFSVYAAAFAANCRIFAVRESLCPINSAYHDPRAPRKAHGAQG